MCGQQLCSPFSTWHSRRIPVSCVLMERHNVRYANETCFFAGTSFPYRCHLKFNLNLKSIVNAGSLIATSSPSLTNSLIVLTKFGLVCSSNAIGA